MVSHKGNDMKQKSLDRMIIRNNKFALVEENGQILEEQPSK